MDFSKILQIGSSLGYADLLFFFVCFLLGVLLYLLGCLANNMRFFVSQILKALAFCVWIASPIVLNLLMQEVFYAPHVSYKMSKKLEYSPAFFVDGEIENQGRLTVRKCYFLLKTLRPNQNLFYHFLDEILPLKTYSFLIYQELQRGQKVEFSHTFNDFDALNYSTQVRCFG